MNTSNSSRRSSSGSGGGWFQKPPGGVDARAAQTIRVFETLAETPPSEYSRILDYYFAVADERADVIPVYWSSFAGMLATWLRWEDECRESRRTCMVDIPEEAKQVGVAAYYSTSIKQVIVMAAEDLAVDWMLPHWILWFSARIGKPLAPKLRRLELEEQLVRITLYPVLVKGLRGIARAAVDYYSYGGSGYAHTTALFVYWDIVSTLYEAVKTAITPLNNIYGKPLANVEEALYIYMRDALARAKTKTIEPRIVLQHVVEELKNGIGRVAAAARINETSYGG